jgi:hypothetical protein
VAVWTSGMTVQKNNGEAKDCRGMHPASNLIVHAAFIVNSFEIHRFLV